MEDGLAMEIECRIKEIAGSRSSSARSELCLTRTLGELGTRKARKMQVPYAKKWQKETDELRKIALGCDLTEETKWGKPCFTLSKKNVAMVIPFKESCALAFFKGALLKDPRGVLSRAGEHSQAGRWIKFTSTAEITDSQSLLRSYLLEAIKLEQAG